MRHGQLRRQPLQNAKPSIRRRAPRGDAARGSGGAGASRLGDFLAGSDMAGSRRGRERTLASLVDFRKANCINVENTKSHGREQGGDSRLVREGEVEASRGQVMGQFEFLLSARSCGSHLQPSRRLTGSAIEMLKRYSSRTGRRGIFARQTGAASCGCAKIKNFDEATFG